MLGAHLSRLDCFLGPQRMYLDAGYRVYMGYMEISIVLVALSLR